MLLRPRREWGRVKAVDLQAAHQFRNDDREAHAEVHGSPAPAQVRIVEAEDVPDRRGGRCIAFQASLLFAFLGTYFYVRSLRGVTIPLVRAEHIRQELRRIGPLSVAWLDGRLMDTAPASLTPTERRLQAGLLGCLVLAVVIVLGGFSGLDAGRPARAVLGVVLALAGGTSIAVSSLLCRTLNDAGVRPATRSH